MSDDDNPSDPPPPCGGGAGATGNDDPHRGPHPELVSVTTVDPSNQEAVETGIPNPPATTSTPTPTLTPPPTRSGTTRSRGLLSSSDHFHHHHHRGLHNQHDEYIGSIGTTTTRTTTQRHSMDSERDVDFDRDVLHRGVRDAGRWAYGTIFVEVWAWNDLGTHLVRPLGGWWLDPIFHIQQHEQLSKSGFLSANNNVTTEGSNEIASNPKCPLCRLTDRNLSTFEPPEPLMIGEGIPGVLWMELQHQRRINKINNRNNNNNNNNNMKSGGGSNSPTSGGGGAGARSSIINNTSGSTGQQQQQQKLIWRQVKDIAQDPDQPYNPRLQLLAQRLVTAIGLAAGVPFDIMGSKGIVVYYARVGVSRVRLQHVDNENYLRAAANLIGSAYALRKPRLACVSRRHYELQQTKARVVRKIRQLGREALLAKAMKSQGAEGDAQPPKMMKPFEVQQQNEPLDTMEAQPLGASTTSSASCLDHPTIQFAMNQTLRIWHKFAGGGNQPPPAFNWTQTIWTFVGVLTTLLTITRINTIIVRAWGSDYSIVLGPFGALMTLMFGLTGAPASQPRNALVGQTISMSIAIGVSKIDAFEPWIKQSVATALAVTTMVKLGVTHPPAGAAALLFAGGKFSWGNVATGLLGNLIAIVAATLINDINPERQYPTFWGIQHYCQVLHDFSESVSSPCRHYHKMNKNVEEEMVELKETNHQEQPVIQQEDSKHA